MARLRIGLNGLGRMGQGIARVMVSDFADRIEFVAANDIVPVEDLAAALHRDSVYGRFPVAVEIIRPDLLRLGDQEVHIHGCRDASQIPWGDQGVDLVLECTGHYLSSEKATAHLEAGAGKVAISAPTKDDTKTVVLGVNHQILSAEDRLVSNAS